MKTKTGKNDDWPYWWDGVTEEEVKGIAKRNFEAFYGMKEALVKKRWATCSMEDMAEALGCTVDDIADFEQYYSDPTISEVQEYALALKMKIGVDVMNYRDAPKEYLSMSIPCPYSIDVGSLEIDG